MTMKYSASEPERQVVYAYADDIKAKDAEIVRLRAALKEIATYCIGAPNDDAESCREIARAAIAND
jgi:hypothetical protein